MSIFCKAMIFMILCFVNSVEIQLKLKKTTE